MEVSSNCLSDSPPTTKMEKCSEIKLTKSSKLFSIESIIANTNKDTRSSNSSESPVPQENYYNPQTNGSEYTLPPSTLLPPGSGHHHYGNIYNNAWFGGLFNAHFANNHPEKDMAPFPNFGASFPNPNEPPRVPLMFNDPSVINAYQREKLAQYFMNSLRTAGGGGGAIPGDCDKLTELIFRTSTGYPGMPLYDGFSDHQSDKSRSPFQEAPTQHQQGPLSNGTGIPSVAEESTDQRHLSSALIGCLPMMSKQIQGGSEIHQQHQQNMSNGDKYDKGLMMDTASNDSCSDDLSLTLSPGESNKHRGEDLYLKLLCKSEDDRWDRGGKLMDRRRSDAPNGLTKFSIERNSSSTGRLAKKFE